MPGVELVYHYTMLDKLTKILASGLILPSAANLSAGEVPVVWFTAFKTVEPSAIKIPISNWSEAPQAMDHQNRDFGAARLGINRRKTLMWDEMCRAATIPAAVQAALSRGPVDPQPWYGVVGSVSLRQLEVIEVLEDADWTCVEGWRPA